METFLLRVTEGGHTLTTSQLSQRQVNRLITVIARQLKAEGWAQPVKIEVEPEPREEEVAA